MKCPKCGYNSFEYHDSCIKCSNDLTGYKATYGIKAIVLPPEVRASMAQDLMAQTALNTPAPETGETPVDMFSFDVPDAPTASAAGDDPFNFDDEPTTTAGGGFSFGDGTQTAQAKEDAFADLLESTSQKESDTFSWDDSPEPAAAAPAKPAEDDFDSLFGDQDKSKS